MHGPKNPFMIHETPLIQFSGFSEVTWKLGFIASMPTDTQENLKFYSNRGDN